MLELWKSGTKRRKSGSTGHQHLRWDMSCLNWGGLEKWDKEEEEWDSETSAFKVGCVLPKLGWLTAMLHMYMNVCIHVHVVVNLENQFISQHAYGCSVPWPITLIECS